MGNFHGNKIKDRIINYWTKRSENFAQLRQEELHSYMSELWLTEITKYLPQNLAKSLMSAQVLAFLPIYLPNIITK